MKKWILIILCLTHYVYGQDLSYSKNDGTKPCNFIDELNKFIISSNYNDSIICKNYVYVIYVYPLNLKQNCIGYTVSYIVNYISYDDVKPQYLVSDNSNIIVINFNPKIKDKKVNGLKLKIISDIERKKIISKLLPEFDIIDGFSKGLIYNNCGDKNEIIYYKNADKIPKDKSIYRNYIEVKDTLLLKGENEK